MITTVITVILVLVFLKLIFSKRLQTYHSHWQTMYQGFSYSSLEFYELLTNELKSKKIGGIKIKNITLREGTVFSAKRVYLQILWEDLEYNICCAVFVDSTFFSSWLLVRNSFFQGLVLKIPFIGKWLYNKMYPQTFYKSDTTSIFMTYVHNMLISTIEEITKETGIRMSDTDKKPILKNIFDR